MVSSHYFGGLNYTLGDEDSAVEYGILSSDAKHVVAVAGSGGRVVPLLARAPKRLTCVDITPAQLELTRFRLAALTKLSRNDYLGLLGFEEMKVSDRMAIASSLGWNSAGGIIERLLESGDGLIYQGRFERMLRQMASLCSIVLGGSRLDFFNCASLDEQRNFIDTQFPQWRWRLLLELLGNSTAMNALLYRGEFPKKNRSERHATIYRKIFNNLFYRFEARRSFFLQMIFLGRLRWPEGYPAECQPDIYAAAQYAIRSTRLEFICGDIVDYVSSSPPVNFVSLSDVPSFLSQMEADSVLTRMSQALCNGGIVVMRGHMRIITPTIDQFVSVSDRFRQLINSDTTQLWHIDAFERS